jgi:hypothetical protein
VNDCFAIASELRGKTQAATRGATGGFTTVGELGFFFRGISPAEAWLSPFRALNAGKAFSEVARNSVHA